MNWVQQALISSMFSAALGVLTNQALKQEVDSVLYSFIRALCIVIALLVYMLIYHRVDIRTAFHSPQAFYYTLASGLVGTITWVTYYSAMASGPAKAQATLTGFTALSYSYIVPFFIYDLFVTRKQMSNLEFSIESIGSILILIGVLIIAFKVQILAKLSS